MKQRTELQRKTPLRSKVGLRPGKPRQEQGRKQRPKQRRKAKPKSRRKQLESAAEANCKAFYQGLPCVICKHEGRINTKGTAGHHIIGKGRCRLGRHDPQNLIPVCAAHHTTGNDKAPHSTNARAGDRFAQWLREFMPTRDAAAKTIEAEQKLREGRKMTIDEIEADYELWAAIVQNKRTYEFVCEMCGIEAWATLGVAK